MEKFLGSESAWQLEKLWQESRDAKLLLSHYGMLEQKLELKFQRQLALTHEWEAKAIAYLQQGNESAARKALVFKKQSEETAIAIKIEFEKAKAQTFSSAKRYRTKRSELDERLNQLGPNQQIEPVAISFSTGIELLTEAMKQTPDIKEIIAQLEQTNTNGAETDSVISEAIARMRSKVNTGE